MSYDKRRMLSLHFAQVDFGAGANTTRVIALPTRPNRDSGETQRFAGGRVVGAIVHNITEDFAGATTDAGVRVGDGSDDDLYYDSGLVLDETADIGESVFLPDDGAAIDIPEGSTNNVTVTFVAATGTPTGIADVTLMINLDDF